MIRKKIYETPEIEVTRFEFASNLMANSNEGDGESVTYGNNYESNEPTYDDLPLDF